MSSRNDYLEHYGVKGMKWGVVNEDESVGRSSGSKEKTDSITKTSKVEEKSKHWKTLEEKYIC